VARHDDDAGFSSRPFANFGMGRGLGDAGVADFEEDVGGGEGFGEGSFGLGDVAWVPVHRGGFVA